jgi:parvulin-like peptidyl-prolyl isomerase
MKGGIIKIRKFILFIGLTVLFFVVSPTIISAQQVVDKTVATVSDGIRTELITYSDLLWQLALQPNAPLTPPTSEDLNRALQLIINQRLFALEAQRLPDVEPGEAEVKEKIQDVLKNFQSVADFERRLRLVGFDSITDDNFQQIMEQRVAIEKYIKFRFRSFVVITPEDEAKYYREVYTPDFRRRNPGLLLPPLEEVRARINLILTEERIARDIERFLDDSKS